MGTRGAGRAGKRRHRQAHADRVSRRRGATGTAVVVAPGGGYAALAMDHEGRQVASWFNAMGVTAFVLKYRLGPRYHHPIELGDAQRAIRIGRAHAPRSSECWPTGSG